MYNQVNDRSKDPSGYVNASGEFGAIPEGEGVVWDSEVLYGNKRWKTFVPQVFIGNGDQGLWWLAVSDEGWVLEKDEPCVRFERDGDVVRLRVRMIARRADISSPRTFDFSLLVEPVKPMRQGWRQLGWAYGKGNRNYYGHDTSGYRYYGDSVDSYAIHSDEDARKLARYFLGEYEKMEPFRAYARPHWERAFKDKVPFVLYGSTWMTGLGMEEFKYYGQEWLGREKWEARPDWTYDGMPSYGGVYHWERPEQLDARGVNFNSTYLDCFIYYHRRLLEHVPVNGTWWDNSSVGVATEYVPGKGRVQVWNTYLRRELTRRLAVMGYVIGRRPWWLQNMHVDFSWCQVGWHIENDFYVRPPGRTLIDQLGIGKFRALLRTKGGLLSQLHTSIDGVRFANSDERTIAIRSILGMSLLHDVGSRGLPHYKYGIQAIFDRVLDPLEKAVGFFSGHPEFLPYWRQDVVSFDEKRVLASFFITDGKAAAIIVNASDKTLTLEEVTFEAGKLGIKAPARVFDAETGENLLIRSEEGKVIARMRLDRIRHDRDNIDTTDEEEELDGEFGEQAENRAIHRHDFRAIIFQGKE